MEKLPIKLFSKREGDEKFVEGGGSTELPRFVLSSEELIAKSSYLGTQLHEIEPMIAKKLSSSNIPAVLTVSIIDDAKAKSHKRKIRKFFESNKENKIIGLLDDNKLLIKIESMNSFNLISERIINTDDFGYQISALSDIKIFTPKMVTSQVLQDYKVKLLSFSSFQENKYLRDCFEDDLSKNNIQFKSTFYSENEIVYRLFKLNEASARKLIEFDSSNGLFSIEPMPIYKISLDALSQDIQFKQEQPEDGIDYEIIGVLDSGIEPINHLKPWIVEDSYSPYPEEYKNKNHGTFIAGIAVYGDLLEDFKMTSTQMFKVLDACVIPDTNKIVLTEDELISNIEEALKLFSHKVKIWTLSISIKREILDDKFSDFGMALDNLQDKYNVIIFKSAGNTDNFMYGKENGRIHEGADSVRSITVGSVAHKSDDESLASLHNVSPFSRIGRGPSSIIKPEIVHYGGNVRKTGIEYEPIGVNSFAANGNPCTAIGTSFSTPRSSGIGAELLNKLDTVFDPILIKSLIIHSAQYPTELDIPNNEKIRYMGFGIPKPSDDILYNDPFTSTLILRDELYKGHYIDIFDFPMPDSLIQNGYFTGNLTVTLVYNPILDGTQGSEYCQSDMDIKFGTYDVLKERDIEKNNILNRFGRDDSHNVLLPNFYSSKKVSLSNSEGSINEHGLIQYRDKYYPVKKYTFSLSNATDSNKEKFLVGNRKWYLYLKGIFRDHIESKMESTGELLSQEFCVVITISDPDKSKMVYDSVAQKLNEFNFVSSNINIKAEIKIAV